MCCGPKKVLVPRLLIVGCVSAWVRSSVCVCMEMSKSPGGLVGRASD